MGNKNTSAHLNRALSGNDDDDDDDHHRYIHQHDQLASHDDIDDPFDIAAYQTQAGKKYGPSPRLRRRQTRQVHADKKGRKPQVCLHSLLPVI